MFYPVLSLWVSTCTKQLYNKIVKTSQLVYIHHFCASEPICTYIYCQRDNAHSVDIKVLIVEVHATCSSVCMFCTSSCCRAAGGR